MGRFSTTIQIKANADFANTFIGLMKKRGFEPCSESDASLSYLIALNGGWATLVREDYNTDPRQASDDAAHIAKEMTVFTVEVVDSDFAILKLNDDEVIVGDGSGYGIEDAPHGSKALWEPLLVSGTFEELTEIWASSEVFVENALCKSAPLLGIDPRLIAADFLDLSESSYDVTALYFKKANAESPMSLNTAFKKVFGEALKPLGFKFIKSKYPYFVRVVPGGEIIHVISYYNDKKCYDTGHNYITIQGGIATVYRAEIDLTHTPKRENWLQHNCSFVPSDELERDKALHERLYSNPSLPEEPLKAMESELELTKRFMLPALTEATSLEYCIKHGFDTNLYDDGCFGASYGNSYYSEGMLYFKTDRSIFDNAYKNAESEYAIMQKAYFERVLGDPGLYAEVQAELERRKTANSEILRSYGLEL